MSYKKILPAVKKSLRFAKSEPDLLDLIVNTPFKYKLEVTQLSLGIISMFLLDKANGSIDRAALSNSVLAEVAWQRSYNKLRNLKIPTDNNKDNVIVQTIMTAKPHSTTDWSNLYTPSINEEEARFLQADSGIGFSAVYPLIKKGCGAIIYSYYQYQEDLDDDQYNFMNEYSEIVSEALVSASKQYTNGKLTHL